jgi:outer membrane protein assembly factor BamB
MTKNKIMIIALALIISMTIGPLLVNYAVAQSSGEMTSYAFIDVAPSPIGVGQTAYVSIWVDIALPQASITNDIRRHNYTLTITNPAGAKETKHWDVIDDSTGIQFLSFTPDQVGNYTFKFDYGGQVYTWNETAAMRVWTGVKILPTTKTTTLEVQQDPIPGARSSYPLPSEYWAHPIEGQNTDWWTISSNWLRGAQFGTFQMTATYNLWQQGGTAPNSPHIMWTKPIEFGGVVGGTSTGVNGSTYYSGGSYEGRFATSLIMNGFLYFKMPKGNNAATSGSGSVGSDGPFVCIDLRTGEMIWQTSAISPSFGQLEWFDSPNQHGVIPSGYLWQISGTTWSAFSGFDGNWLFNITDVPTGKDVYSANGEYTRYVLNYNTTARSGWMALWNFTQVLTQGTLTSTGYRPVGLVYNSTQRLSYSWNVTIPALNGLSAPSIQAVLPGDVILGSSSSITPAVGSTRAMPNPYTVWAISDKPATRGQLLWIRNYAAPAGNISRNFGPLDPVNRVWMMEDGETQQWVGYSLDDGSPLWGPTETPVRDMQFFGSGEGMGQRGVTAYGNLYVQGFGGEIFCFSTKTGTLLWKYGSSSVSGLETPWGIRPIFIAAVADGKIYVFNNEHSPNSPYYKNNKVYCLDAFNGTELWSMLGWAGQSGGTGASTSIVADGFWSYYNYYDNQVYVVGKGPSATTITASPKVSTMGDSVLIEGTVTDTAAGTQESQQIARFPNGVPAVSDVSMGDWMAYVYMQKPRPTNTIGVPITLSVVDSNGNYRDIGTTTSNADGSFVLNWKPDIEGTYTVYASFAGSNSYWPSHAVTAFAVNAAHPTIAPTETPVQSAADMYFVPAIAGLFVLIIIVLVLLVLMMLKKRA